ncbi:MAG: LPXTG cell wall anchor domain-containing protein [Oscillospiraceae bacterium]
MSLEPTAKDKDKEERICSKCGYIEKSEISATGTTGETDSETPKTGDDNNAVLWAVLMLAAAGLGIVILRRRPER